MANPYIIYSMGRSRSAWLSAFLNYKDWKSYHEVLQRCRSLQNIRELLSIPNIGIVETGAIAGRLLIKYACPDIREVVILRNVEDAMASLLKTETHGLVTWDLDKLHRIMHYSDRELRKLSKNPNVLTIEFEELSTAEGCKKIFEFCLPYEFDQEWWELGKDQNIQVDMKQFFIYYNNNRDQIELFKKQLKTDLRRLREQGVITRERT
jgi:hypothetical protein